MVWSVSFYKWIHFFCHERELQLFGHLCFYFIVRALDTFQPKAVGFEVCYHLISVHNSSVPHKSGVCQMEINVPVRGSSEGTDVGGVSG